MVTRFQAQIEAGGPVTVTHPEVRRYLMLIPESVHLVLQAASLGEQGTIYVLDMGEQIKLVDLARNLIRLSGFVPGQEIPIAFVGLRPGEKLYEELVGADEKVEASSVEKILRVRVGELPDVCHALKKVRKFEQPDILKKSYWAINWLREMVPTFRPSPVSPRRKGAVPSAQAQKAMSSR